MADEPTCTDELILEVTELVQLGVPPVPAVMAQGVPEDLAEEWLKSTQEQHEKLVAEIRVAEARCEAIVIGRIREAAKTNWNAAAWLAERRFPERYVRRSVNAMDEEEADRGEIRRPDPFDEIDDAQIIPLRKK